MLEQTLPTTRRGWGNILPPRQEREPARLGGGHAHGGLRGVTARQRHAICTSVKRFSGVLLVLCLLAACRGEKAPANRKPGSGTPQTDAAPGRVLVIGADALDPAMVDALVAKGRLPNLAHLMEGGAHGILYSEREIRSPALWTTVATGRPRQVHGVYDFVTGSRLWPEEVRSDEKHLVTSNMRDAPAVWNLASDQGVPVAVVGWLNTWPAETVEGIMVSPYVALGKSKQITIKGAVYDDEPHQVYPEERWPEIKALIVGAEDVPESLVNQVARPPPRALADMYPLIERYRAAVRWSLAHTLTMRNVLLHLLAKDAPRLAMVFFEGADSLGHRFWLFGQPVEQIEAQLQQAGLPTAGAASLARLYGNVIEEYYEILDHVVGALVAAVPKDTVVLVVSDHGFGNRSQRWPVNPHVPFEGEHRLEGFVLVHGPGVAPGSDVYGATLYDVAPTVMEALGVRVDTPMEGASLLPDSPRQQSKPPPSVENPVPVTAPIASPYDEQEVDRLKSLGYVQ